ncbi:MAG: hypothetical protein FLDDKLPJ_02799 [Phycisphaerae bacterium]|nr:hypothetical protein [Phycisphaerae bacterium]
MLCVDRGWTARFSPFLFQGRPTPVIHKKAESTFLGRFDREPPGTVYSDPRYIRNLERGVARDSESGSCGVPIGRRDTTPKRGGRPAEHRPRRASFRRSARLFLSSTPESAAATLDARQGLALPHDDSETAGDRSASQRLYQVSGPDVKSTKPGSETELEDAGRLAFPPAASGRFLVLNVRSSEPSCPGAAEPPLAHSRRKPVRSPRRRRPDASAGVRLGLTFPWLRRCTPGRRLDGAMRNRVFGRTRGNITT